MKTNKQTRHNALTSLEHINTSFHPLDLSYNNVSFEDMFASIFNLNSMRRELDKIKKPHSEKEYKTNYKHNEFYRLFATSIELNNQLQKQLEAKNLDIKKKYQQIVIGPKDAKILFEDWDKDLNHYKVLATRWYAFTKTFFQINHSIAKRKAASLNHIVLLLGDISNHFCPLELLVSGILNNGHINLIPYIKDWQHKVDTWNDNICSQNNIVFSKNKVFGLDTMSESINVDEILKAIAETFNDLYQLTLSKMIAKLIPDLEQEGPTVLKLHR